MAKPSILIINANYYTGINAALLEGAKNALEAKGAVYDHIEVPGALEIPAALAMVLDASDVGGKIYDGFVVIGCVIRGETTHYDTVSNESARALVELSTTYGLALGNAILTVENEDQAWARAKVSEKNLGGWAANTALSMIDVRERVTAQIQDVLQ